MQGQGQGHGSYQPYNNGYQQGQYNQQQQQFQGAGSNHRFQQQGNNTNQPQHQQQQPYMRQQGNRYPQDPQRTTTGQYGNNGSNQYGAMTQTYQPPGRGAVLSGGGYYDPYAMAYAQDSNVMSTGDALSGQMMQLNLNQNHVPGMAQGGAPGPGPGQPASVPTSAPQGDNGYVPASPSMAPVNQYEQQDGSQGTLMLRP
jgi:hypothetical protein